MHPAKGDTMANIIDYVQWRGDIPLDQVPVGAVDALVLSYLAYMPFYGLADESFEGEGMLLADAAEKLLEAGVSSTCMIDSLREDCSLLEAVRESERFGTMRVVGFEERYDQEKEEQFAAVTFVPPVGPVFVAFRGTDSTVVGWKEDFNMSFVREVPAQRAAAAYTADAAIALGRPMILGGHSKGGNLAVYAGIFSDEPVQAQIACVYNFDGPGFNEEIIALDAFKKVDMRIHTLVPQSSMVGILLWHAEPFTVVRSDAAGLFQHNPYSWQVMGGRFITLPERTKESRLAEQTIKHWLTGLPGETRAQIIDGIYSVLSVSEGRNVSDLFEGRNVRAILKAVGSMDEETKEVIVDAFRMLGSSFKEAIPDWVDRTAGQFRTMIAQRTEQEKNKDRG